MKCLQMEDYVFTLSAVHEKRSVNLKSGISGFNVCLFLTICCCLCTSEGGYPTSKTTQWSWALAYRCTFRDTMFPAGGWDKRETIEELLLLSTSHWCGNILPSCWDKETVTAIFLWTLNMPVSGLCSEKDKPSSELFTWLLKMNIKKQSVLICSSVYSG